MDVIAVWLIDSGYFFCRIVVCAVYKSQAYFMLNPRLSVTHNICLHFYFVLSRPVMGGI